MAGIPLDSPQQDSAFNPAAQPPEQKIGLFGRIMGQKHQQNLRTESRTVEFLMDQLKTAAEKPDLYPPDVIKLFISQAGKYLGKDTGAALTQHFEQLDAKRDVERRQAMLPGHGQSQSQPATGGMAGALGGQASPQPQAAAPAAPMGEFSPMQKSQLIQLALQQQQQGQQGPPQAPQGQQGPLPGGLPRPSEAGGPAGAAPAQPNPVEQMQKGSALGGTGFNTPPPMSAPPAPAAEEGGWFNSPAQRGASAAAVEGPGLEQKNRLALSLRAGQTQQDVAADIAQGERRVAALRADPGFSKLPALQQQEMLMRARGIQGAVSNITRPMNLPASDIHGSEIPEGSLTITGTPTDPSKWYRQQQDMASGDIRYVQVTPRTTIRQVLTTAGPVLVSLDRRGEIVKVNNAANGAEIVDPRLLETIRNTITKTETVDAQGNAVTVYDPIQSTSKKVLPGKGGVAMPAQITAPPTAAGAPGVTTPQASSGQTVRPKPLTGSTRSAAEFAQTIQPHIPRIIDLVSSLERNGKLGVIVGRWNEFLAGKVGAGDPEFTKLRTDLALFETALGRVHGGARGGGSTTMLEHFKSLSDSGKMDAPTLKAALGELKDWVNTYAGMGANRPGAVQVGNGIPAPPAAAGGITPPPAAAPRTSADYLQSIGHK